MNHIEYANRLGAPHGVRNAPATWWQIDLEARERQIKEDIRAGRRKPPKPTAPPKPTRSSTPRRDAARRWLDSVN